MEYEIEEPITLRGRRESWWGEGLSHDGVPVPSGMRRKAMDIPGSEEF